MLGLNLDINLLLIIIMGYILYKILNNTYLKNNQENMNILEKFSNPSCLAIRDRSAQKFPRTELNLCTLRKYQVHPSNKWSNCTWVSQHPFSAIAIL